MFFVGVNIGALTVKVVVLRAGATNAVVVAHQGRPLEVLQGLSPARSSPTPAISACPDIWATSLRSPPSSGRCARWAGGFDAVVSLGGESFLVYILADGRIANVLSHNKCAAGSGEFFVQQIGRMGLDLEEAIRRSFQGQVVPLASRCSVHCKSDITHKLNRNEATLEDILHTLHDSMADKVVALLEKAQRELRRVLVIGGVSRNAAMLAALREKLPATEFVVLPESPWFEAWGCALLTRDEPRHLAPTHAPARPGLPPPSRATPTGCRSSPRRAAGARRRAAGPRR